MKRLKFNITSSIAILLLISQVLLSCKDEVVVNNTADQLFSPALFSAAIITNVASLSWTPIANSTYYVLEISKDSLLFTNELVADTIVDKYYYSIQDLWSNTRYSARIMAVSKDPKIKDSKFLAITFKTKTENIFYEVPAADIATNQVQLKWNALKQVSKIVYYVERSTNKTTIDLTSEEWAFLTGLLVPP
ncbi:MAG: fibronectin type III domain-containing protein, partial [Paludibacter sp.]